MTTIERMGRSPLLADITPVGGAVFVSVSQMKTMGTEARGVSIRRVVLTELSFQFLKEFQHSFDEECIEQVGFNLLTDCVFDAQSFESS